MRMEMKESFLSKFFLATIPAIVIAFATNIITKRQAAIDLAVAYYLPVNQRINFNGKILDDGRIISGTSTDPQGLVSAISLHR
jgi:hypothetical protein